MCLLERTGMIWDGAENKTEGLRQKLRRMCYCITREHRLKSPSISCIHWYGKKPYLSTFSHGSCFVAIHLKNSATKQIALTKHGIVDLFLQMKVVIFMAQKKPWAVKRFQRNCSIFFHESFMNPKYYRGVG